MIITPSDSFSRPTDTTQYADGDLVANSATAGEVVPLTFSLAKLGTNGRGRIKRVRFFKDDETVTAADFILHLFSQSPTVANGDNGAFSVTTAEFQIASIDMDVSTGAVVSSTDLAESFAVSPEIGVDLGRTGAIYGLIEADGTYTPASGETFKVTLEIEA